MKRIISIAIAIILTIALASCSTASGTSESSAEPDGLSELETRSLKESLANGKPTLADFGGTNCVSCRAMKITLEELDPVYRDRVNLVIVLEDGNEDLFIEYRIMAIPTQVFFDSSGKPITGHVGYMEKEAILAQFKEMGIE